MTSKISFFSIMKEDLRHRGWMIALSLLCSFLSLPVFFLLCQRSYASYTAYNTPNQLERLSIFYQRFFFNEAVVTQGIVLTIGAFIVAIWGFRYLYSQEMTDAFHALPVTRTRLFFAHYLDGLLIWFLPFLFSLFCALLLALVHIGSSHYFAPIIAAALKSIPIYLFAFLMVYHLCLVTIMISGNAFNAIISCVILGIGAASIFMLFDALSSVFFKNYLCSAFPTEYITWLSPLICLILLLSCMGDLVMGNTSAFTPEFIFLFSASFLVMAGNLFAAWKLYLNRSSELCQRGITNKWFQLCLRTLAAIGAGFSGSAIFIAFLGTENILGWCIFGTILCSILCFGIIDIVFHMDFKAFFCHRLQMGIVTAFSVFIVLSLSLDFFGYDSYIPSQNNISSISLSVSNLTDNSYDISNTDDTVLFQATTGSIYDMGAEYTDSSIIYNLLSALAQEPEDTPKYGYTNVKVNLKNGGTFYRKYRIGSKAIEFLRPIVESDSYRDTYYKLSSGNLNPPSEIEVYDSKQSSSHYLSNSSDIQKVMDAYAADFKEHYNLEELDSSVSLAELIVSFPLSEGYTTNCTLNIPANFYQTISALKEINPEIILTLDDLDISKIELFSTLDSNLPKEALYSNFGLEGYSDNEISENQNKENQENTDNVDNVIEDSEIIETTITNPSTNNPYSKDSKIDYYTASFTKSSEIEELLPYLYLGEKHYSTSFFNTEFLLAATIYDSSGNTYNCYIKAGSLPKKWIDAMELSNTPQRN